MVLTRHVQVVAGTKYSFDISLDPSKCDKDAESERTTCHIKVINVPWLGKQEVLWDETTCEKQVNAQRKNQDIILIYSFN